MLVLGSALRGYKMSLLKTLMDLSSKIIITYIVKDSREIYEDDFRLEMDKDKKHTYTVAQNYLNRAGLEEMGDYSLLVGQKTFMVVCKL